MKRFHPIYTFAVARWTGLALLALCGAATGAGAVDVPVRYRLEASALRTAVAGTPVSFELYSDAACTSLVYSTSVPVEDVAVFARLTRVGPQGGSRPPRTVELMHTLTQVPSGSGPLYLAVSGPGVVPVPATERCQVQAAAAAGSGGSGAPTPFKRTRFEFVPIPAVNQPPTALTWFFFTPPVSGTALLRARGYCNLSPIAGSNNQIGIAIGASPATAFAGGKVSNWGIINIPPGSTPGLYQEQWSAEETIPVTAGQLASAYLMGRHETGNTTNTDCSGSLTVEIVAAPMP